MKTSDAGLNLIKDFEQLRLHVYDDQGGKPTIGWGHLLQPGENFLDITKEQADNLLKDDLTDAEKTVNKLVKVPLTQNKFDALVSFVFNVGIGNFMLSTLLKKLNAKDYEAIPEQLKRWVYVKGKKSKGLERRRNAEINLWKGGV